MAGTKAGGMKAAATNKKLHGEDFYARIGKKGGQNGHTGGFAANPELAKIAGAKGGRKSRRTGVKNGQGGRKKVEKKLEENFKANGKTYLVRCPKCKKENYAMAVSSGVCCWCGYDANKDGDEE